MNAIHNTDLFVSSLDTIPLFSEKTYINKTVEGVNRQV